MKKAVLTLSIAAVVGVGSFLADGPFQLTASASKLEDLKSQKSEIQSKRSNINSQIDKKDQQINAIKQEQESVEEQIKRIDFSISDTENRILEKQQEIKETKGDIEKLKEEIKVITKRIEVRNELLKERARSFQENGTVVSYLDVLMGAKSFGDFIDRIGAVATIMEADQSILEEHKKDKERLEKARTEVEEKLASLEKMANELEGMKQKLNSEKAEKDKLMASLKEKQGQLEGEKLSLKEEEQILAAQEAAMKKAIQLEQQRLAAQKKANSGGNRSGGATPPVSSGAFTKPAAGYISSGFGPRSLGNHYGVDIAASGTVPIVAAADGVVIRSYYSDSYGNCIFISHSINGQIYTTVYAHMSSRLASEGQVVSKGQKIGYMGNTGRSYGQHLHFELHKGPWEADKRNAINPVGIVPL